MVSSETIKEIDAKNNLKKSTSKIVLDKTDQEALLDKLYKKMTVATRSQLKKLLADNIELFEREGVINERAFKELIAKALGRFYVNEKELAAVKNAAKKINDVKNIEDNIDALFNEYMKAKKQHMDIGAKNVKNLLEDSVYGDLSEKQKERIIHLVRVHDDLESIKDLDERILVEADTLAGLDTDFMKPTFDPESNEKYLNSVKKKRLSLFTTDFSIKTFDIVLQKRVDYYKKGLWIDRH